MKIKVIWNKLIVYVYYLLNLSKYYCCIISFSFFIFCSCKKERETSFSGDTNNFHHIFIEFWEKMNSQYVYWDRETVDWNSVYKNYKPLFDALTNSDDDKKQAVSYFKQMTAELMDHHLSITFLQAPFSGTLINPAYDRKIKTTDYHARYNYNSLVESYLDKGFLSGKGNLSSNGELINATAGTINGNLLYFHCNFFALQKSFNSDGDNKIKQALTYFFSEIKRDSSPIKGIILDLRLNSGGNIEDLNFFAGKLVNHDVLFGYTRGKSGLGKLNYLPWLESRLKHDSDYGVNVPIMMLCDNFSASLSEIMIIALKSKTNLLIGEQTYGATGPLSDPDIFNSGSFNVGTFLSVKTSAVEFKGLDGKFYEGVGVIPDIQSPFNLKELSSGKDSQLELAIKQLN